MKNTKKHLAILTFCTASLFCAFTANAATINNGEQNNITQQAQQESQININKATAEELAKALNGVGINKAKRIVEYREKLGPFVSIEQLKEVSGIGQSILDKNAGKIRL